MIKPTNILLLASVALAMPLVASAQSADAKYCAALVDKYQHAKGSPDARVALAMEECRAGRAAESIPVLEGALRDSTMDLPPHIKPVRARGS